VLYRTKERLRVGIPSPISGYHLGDGETGTQVIAASRAIQLGLRPINL
jgi:hypothetical protein